MNLDCRRSRCAKLAPRGRSEIDRAKRRYLEMSTQAMRPFGDLLMLLPAQLLQFTKEALAQQS